MERVGLSGYREEGLGVQSLGFKVAAQGRRSQKHARF